MEFLSSGPGPSAWAVGLCALFLAVAGIWGRSLLGFLGFDGTALTRTERAVFSLGLGLTALSLAVLAAGLLGALNAPVLAAALTAITLATLWRRPVRFARPSAPRGFHPIVIFPALVLGLSLLNALTPPAGTDGLSYHLSHPRLFIEEGRIFRIPHARESLWPYLTEMLFTLGLLFQGTILAKLFHWIFFPLTAAALYCFGRRFWDAGTGAAAALVFLLTPAAFAQAGYAYVDLSFAFYALLTAYAFFLYDQSPDARTALLTGLCAGGALSVKYLALGCAFIWGTLLIVRSPKKAAHTALFAAGCAGAAGVWYLRSWWVAGNPVYPFFPGFFGGNGLESDIGSAGMGTGFVHFLLLPWNMTLHPDFFGGEWPGPLYLLFAPFVLLRKKSRAFGYAACFAALYAYFLFGQSQNVRFFLSLAPLGAVATARGWRVLRKRGRLLKHAAAVVVATVVLLHTGLYFYRTRDAWAVVTGRETAAAYLERRDRAFKAHRYLAAHVRPGETVFNAVEARVFYNQVQGLVTLNGIMEEAFRRENMSVIDHLEETDYDYLWLFDRSDPRLREYARAHGYREVFSYPFIEGSRHFVYTIFEKKR